ncbi:calmodulin-binding protein 25-like [Zingiber officinale]|uniref:VQ domain-containing protein n=1 Tax=Zingiber officinale TaxID=94328 RepID=A0A8J5FIP6_ZINOF|nr:calmodulin-binding protein 25-like [Zingiber officinale]KAG6489067.1 hypothetical protein ZIOFF_050325 [Zingiber officinale]
MENSSVLDQWAHSCADAFPGDNDASFAALLSHSTPPVVGAVASPESLAFLLQPPRLDSIAGERVQKKRKSRSSKRSPITYFTADPAHFRELVQRITGAHPPETARSFPLPTLDASSSFDPAGFIRPTPFGSDPLAGEFDPLLFASGFPTPELDSWGGDL